MSGRPPNADVLEGPGYLYRPEQLVVNNEDLHLVAEQLKRVQATVAPESSPASFAEHGIPITVFQ